MFTGIIQEVGRVESIEISGGTRRLEVSAPAICQELRVGDSVAVSGVCLTAVDITGNKFAADLAAETWERASFSRLSPGAAVNLELPLKAEGRLDGHMVQGHVDGTGRFLGLEAIPGAKDYWLHVEVPSKLGKYLVYKGSVAIEGISLTVAKLCGNTLSVAIIPHTCDVTNLGSLKLADPVNIETDIAARYLEKWNAQGAELEDDVVTSPRQESRFAIVASRFNSLITDRLLEGALDTFHRNGVSKQQVEVVRVPGAYEIPVTAKLLAETKRFDAVVCIGCLIRGETLHYELIANEAARGIGQSALESGVPHAFGIVTCDTAEQALDRAGLKAGNKGSEAAMAAMEMARFWQQLKMC